MKKSVTAFAILSALIILLIGFVYLPKGSLLDAPNARNESSTTSPSNLTEHKNLDSLNSSKISTQADKPRDALIAQSHTVDATEITELPHERIKRIANPSDFQQALLAEQTNFHRYPPHVRPLSPEQPDPIVQGYAIDQRTTRNEDGSAALTLWSDEKIYGVNDTVYLYAQLFKQTQVGPDDSIDRLEIKGQYRAQLIKQNKILSEFEFSSSANSTTGPTGSHSTQTNLSSANASFALSLSKLLSPSADTGIYKIIVKETQTGITDAITFTLSSPGIELTGKFRDRKDEQGNLLIEAEVNITSSNRYYVQASLYDQQDSALGVTQFSGQLAAGLHWIPLSYPGLLFHDLQLDGPYVLKQMSLAKVAMPLERTPLLTPNFETQAYRYDEFSSNVR